MKYIENQIAWIVLPAISAILIFLTLSYLYQWGDSPITLLIYLLMMPLFAIILLLFYKMKTTVDRKEIVVSYGIGIVKKRILLIDIEEMVVARNRLIYGLGIRVIKGGVIYNIHSLNGIELRFRDRKGFIRIGSKTPDKLISEIELRIKHMHK